MLCFRMMQRTWSSFECFCCRYILWAEWSDWGSSGFSTQTPSELMILLKSGMKASQLNHLDRKINNTKRFLFWWKFMTLKSYVKLLDDLWNPLLTKWTDPYFRSYAQLFPLPMLLAKHISVLYRALTNWYQIYSLMSKHVLCWIILNGPCAIVIAAL